MPLITISVWLGASIVMPSGIGKLTGCEKPNVRLSVLPCTCARKPTPTSSSFFSYPLVTPSTMLARCARVAPACVRERSGSVYLISSFLSVCTTDTPRVSGTLSEPFAPLMVTESADTLAVTPWGRLTGAFAILDMVGSLRHDAQDFTALSDRARLFVGHHALGRGHDDGAHAAEHLGQLVLAAIDAQARTAHPLDAIDDGAALEILQPDDQRWLAAIAVGAEIGDVTLVLQHFHDGRLELRGSELHLVLARGLAIADASQQIGNRIG